MSGIYNYSSLTQVEGSSTGADYLLGGCSSHYDAATTIASAAQDEFEWMANFRTVVAVLDILYVLMAFGQKRMQGGRFPSKRYDGSRKTMILHIILGTVIIYMGTFLHIQDQFFHTVTKSDDEQHLYRHVLYYILAFSTIVHSYTVFLAVPKVMGERRLTIPLYTIAGILNLCNAIQLIYEPTLQNAFLVWGSVNTFIFVRLYLYLLSFQHLDWELCYTYGLVTAAATVYPLTCQNSMIYFIWVSPLVYGPFHERFCEWVCIPEEDIYNGNMPAVKNVGPSMKKMRAALVDKPGAKNKSV